MNNKGADQSAQCAGWSALLLFTSPEDRFYCVDAHILAIDLVYFYKY